MGLYCMVFGERVMIVNMSSWLNGFVVVVMVGGGGLYMLKIEVCTSNTFLIFFFLLGEAHFEPLRRLGVYEHKNCH